MRCRLILVLGPLILLVSQVAGAQPIKPTLEPCTLPGVESEVRCGSYKVFEHRRTKTGRQISLFIAVLPALEKPAEPDPLFFIAGGPGQGASILAGFAIGTAS